MLLICVALLYFLLAPDSLSRTHQLDLKEKQLQEDIARLKLGIMELGEEISLLDGHSPVSKTYLERLARNEMGMIAMDEKRIIMGHRY